MQVDSGVSGPDPSASGPGSPVDIRIFQFSLLEIGNWVNADQSTGRIVHEPNALVFTEPLSNY